VKVNVIVTLDTWMYRSKFHRPVERYSSGQFEDPQNEVGT